MLDNKIVESYEQTLRDLTSLKDHLNDKSNNCVQKELLHIIKRGWEQIETMYDVIGIEKKQNLKSEKERLQRHFNEMLRLMPITRPNTNNNDNT